MSNSNESGRNGRHRHHHHGHHSGDHSHGPYCGRGYHGSRYRGPGHRMPWPLKAFVALVFIPGIAFLFGWVTMLLWNALMPAVFGVTAITFWQALGLVILGRLLFGGRPGRRHGHGFGFGPGMFPRKPRFSGPDEWRSHLREKFAEDNADRYTSESRSDSDRETDDF